MNFSLLIQLCGVPLLLVVLATSVMVTCAACYLVFSVRQENLLVAFLPLTLLPLVPAFFVLFTGTLSSIGLQLDTDSDIAFDSGLALQMNLVPVFLGVLASLPPALVTALGRWMLVWKASGIVLFPPRESAETETIDPETWESKETDEYLDQLIRPR